MDDGRSGDPGQWWPVLTQRECRHGHTAQVSRFSLPGLNHWALGMERVYVMAEIQDLLAKLNYGVFMVSQPSLNRPNSGNEKAGDSVCQDSRGRTSIWMTPGWPQPLGVHRNGTFPEVCPTALPSVPSLLSAPASPSTLFLCLFTSQPSPHESNQALYCSLPNSCHLPSSTKLLVSLCGGTGPLMAEHKLHVVGAEHQHPQVTSGLKTFLPWAPSLVFPKGFFFYVIRASWQLCTMQLNTQVLFPWQICWLGGLRDPESPSPRSYHYSLCPYMY